MQNTDIYKYHNSLKSKRLVAFKGPFEKIIIAAFGNLVQRYTKNNNKIFKVFIELAQNVAYYSEERKIIDGKDIGIGSLAIGSNDEKLKHLYVISVGNRIKKNDLMTLKKKCDIINHSTRDELRAIKRRERSLLPGTNDNAHIGLIHSALISKSPLFLVEDNINDEFSYFTLSLYIDRVTALRNEL